MVEIVLADLVGMLYVIHEDGNVELQKWQGADVAQDDTNVGVALAGKNF